MFFSKLTGKKHVLITNSCRSALFLAYKAIGNNGDVVTSPLTCKAAIDPIVESGNMPVFADIDVRDLNIRPDDVVRKITGKAIAIQAIHLGGVACDMERILSIAKKNNLLVIEDCAQSLGATYKGKATGFFGDIACFSLIKNAYGIGGGILATDEKEIYQKAKDINDKLNKVSFYLACYRIFRNLVDTKRKYAHCFLLYRFMMSLKKDRQSYDSVQGQLKRVRAVEKKISAHQLSRLIVLHEKRKKIGRSYSEKLAFYDLMKNHQFNANKSSFTKFFVYHPDINSAALLKSLNGFQIEVMHLEQKNGSPLQKRILPEDATDKNRLRNYAKIHDCLISLPVSEELDEKQIDYITKSLRLVINENR